MVVTRSRGMRTRLISVVVISRVGTKVQTSSSSTAPPPRDLVVVVVVRVLERVAVRFGAFSGGRGRQPTCSLLRRHSTQAGAHCVSATQTQPWLGSLYQRP